MHQCCIARDHTTIRQQRNRRRSILRDAGVVFRRLLGDVQVQRHSASCRLGNPLHFLRRNRADAVRSRADRYRPLASISCHKRLKIIHICFGRFVKSALPIVWLPAKACPKICGAQ